MAHLLPNPVIPYRPEIDGLRAIAVMSVILFHGGFAGFNGGYVGVDVFFVISGYLITTILLKEKSRDTFSLREFYLRRARRILPALFLVALACLPFAWLFMAPAQLRDFSTSLIAVSIFASNFYFAKRSGYFEAAAEEKPLLHTWSLAVEEQFYLVYPLAVILLWRFGIRKVVLALVLVATLSFSYAEWGWRVNPAQHFFSTTARVWELLVGSLVAFGHMHTAGRHGIPVEVRQILSAFGLALVCAAVVLYDRAVPYPSAYTAIPVLGAALIVAFAGADTWAGRSLSARPFVSVGLISYSAYLWHFPIFAFAHIRTGESLGPSASIAAVAATLVLSWLSWRWVETPFRTPRTRRSVVVASALTASVAFVLLGAIGRWADGFPSRLGPDELAAYETIKASDLGTPPVGPCHLLTETVVEAAFAAQFEICAKRHGPALVLIGDSHGYDLFNVLVYNSNRPFIAAMARGACRPYPARAHCHYEAALEFVSRHSTAIDAVIFTQVGSYYLTGPPRPLPNEEMIRHTQEYLNKLPSDLNVVWLGPKAEPNVDLRNMNVLFRAVSARDGLRENRSLYALDDRLGELAKGRTYTYVSTIKAVQYDFTRDFFYQGRYTYSDTDHWSVWGEQVFGARLAKDPILGRLLLKNAAPDPPAAVKPVSTR